MPVSDLLAALDAQVTRSTTIEKSAAALIRGISGRIQDAVNKALAGGATADQLAPIQAEVDALKASESDLSAAISENTPASDTGGGTEPSTGGGGL